MFSVDLDNQEFSAGQAGSLLAALVQRRRQALMNAAHSQSPQGGYGLMNGGMSSMLQPGMPGQQRPMGPMTPMDLLRAQMPRTMGEISSSGMMGYTTTITTGSGQTGGSTSVVATQSIGGRDMMPGAWPHQGVMQRPVRDAEIKPPQTSTLPSQVESTAPPGMYSGMRPGSGPASGRGPAQGFPSYYQ